MNSTVKMKGKYKKIIFLLILYGILAICAVGCVRDKRRPDDREEQESDPDMPGWQLHSDDEVSLDWYVNFTWYTTPWGENIVSKAITEETGIHINFITPMGSEAEKFNALIASDSLPDIMTLGWWENQVDEMIDKEMVYALNELADQYEPYFWEVADRTVVNWYTREDGNIYCYPNSSYVPSDYEEHHNIGSNQTFLVRKDIYEAIGSPDMTTPEGFMNAVRKAAELYPQVDGEPLIPIGAHDFTDTGCVSFDQYLQNFLAIPYEKDGKFYDRYPDAEYIRWLKVFRQLGEEGYLKNDIFIDQRTQMEEKVAKGQYFCMLYQRTDIEIQQKKLYMRDPDMIYIAVDGPKNTKGEDHVLPGTGINGWTVTLISKNCERPDRAMELFSYLMSEHGQLMTGEGVEGVTYDLIDGKPVMKQEIRELLQSDRKECDRLYGVDNAYWMFQDNVMQMQWKDMPLEPMAQPEIWTYPYTRYLGQYETVFETNSEAGIADIAIKKLWSGILPELLLAPTEEDFDRIMEDFINKRERLGFSIVMEESTRQMNAAKEKLGLNEGN